MYRWRGPESVNLQMEGREGGRGGMWRGKGGQGSHVQREGRDVEREGSQVQREGKGVHYRRGEDEEEKNLSGIGRGSFNLLFTQTGSFEPFSSAKPARDQ